MHSRVLQVDHMDWSLQGVIHPRWRHRMGGGKEPIPRPAWTGRAQSASSAATGFLLDCQPEAQQPDRKGHLHGDQKSQEDSLMGSEQ